jgi:hypothetical protein
LRESLSILNKRGKSVRIKHWGRIGDELNRYLNSFRNIRFQVCKPVPREILLQELHNVDCFLLPCADDLIWEPTTSVFDYILYDKPVIFTGLKNNEAFMILQNTNTDIVEIDQLHDFDFINHQSQPKSNDVLLNYSREAYRNRFVAIVEGCQRR